jgi:hypothetical protein
MANIRQYIEDFQGDNDDYERLIKVFVKLRNFLKVVIKYNLQDEIDIEHLRVEALNDDPELWDFLSENGFLKNMNYDPLEDEVKNSYLLWGLDKNPTETLNFIANNLLNDVEIRDDGYWLKLADREELAKYFSESRIVEKVFSEDGLGHDWYFDTNVDVFEDVISNLNKVNLERIAQKIVEEIGNTKLSTFDYTSSFFKELSEKQGSENTFEITNENVMELFINEKALNELLNGDLDELNSELVNLYLNAENAAYEDEIYRNVYDGLEDFFSSKVEEKSFKVGEKVRYIPYIRIKDFKYDVKSFLKIQEGYYIHTLEYVGGYTEMMNELFYAGTFEQIVVHFPDYPDWSDTKRLMNEFFDL